MLAKQLFTLRQQHKVIAMEAHNSITKVQALSSHLEIFTPQSSISNHTGTYSLSSISHLTSHNEPEFHPMEVMEIKVQELERQHEWLNNEKKRLQERWKEIATQREHHASKHFALYHTCKALTKESPTIGQG